MVSDKEWQLKTVETFLKEEEQKAATNFQLKKKTLDIKIKKQKEFDIVFNKGTRVHTNTLTLLFIKSDSFKFGISISKKHGKAHIRNRIKRLARASVREVIKDYSIPYHLVILPKVRDSYNFNEFVKDLKYSLKKGKIIND